MPSGIPFCFKIAFIVAQAVNIVLRMKTQLNNYYLMAPLFTYEKLAGILCLNSEYG
jgi:hypothetical protein